VTGIRTMPSLAVAEIVPLPNVTSEMARMRAVVHPAWALPSIPRQTGLTVGSLRGP